VPVQFRPGARRPIVEEPLAWVEEYPIWWREPRHDLAELARLCWVNGMTLKQIAARLALPLANIKGQFESLRRYDFDVPGLSAEERERFKWDSKK
jgi:hypothetical protein